MQQITKWFFIVLFKECGERKEHDILLRKKTEEKQNSAALMISVDGKGTIFPVILNYKGNSLNKYIKEANFKKDLMNLIQTIQMILFQPITCLKAI